MNEQEATYGRTLPEIVKAHVTELVKDGDGFTLFWLGRAFDPTALPSGGVGMIARPRTLSCSWEACAGTARRPSSGLTIVIFTNTAIEGCNGAFPKDVFRAVYADLAA